MNDTYATLTAHFETIVDFLRFGVSQAHASNLFYGHGTDNAWDDMLALILGSLSLPLDCDPLLLQARLTSVEKQMLVNRLSCRIIEKIPVPYLTNEAYFCDLAFYVDERVLIPRSPIAELIKQQFSPWIDTDRVENILDMCTGSACIAIACHYAFPDALIDAVDISTSALEVAAINRERHGLQDILTLIESDCWVHVPKKQYDLIVANPPYVGSEEMQTLPKEYLHEPRLALETDNNGLAIVEKILAKAHDYLSEHGILVVEVGNSEEALVEAFPQVPFTWLDFEYGGHGVFLLTYQQLKAHFAP
ncbi:50S ribosomal protein L3 N(5)-glutamine methyltransferase [Legionella micdadei]|uniref:50S ribosomal protein L3 N(5)-glutamine methyltransferase n=1 Tax=Legionella micdadei TaxID=451 RepID=UPI0009EF7B88|nr:50S ribosomal protein L3 N(5)-glutamine methyltransferase [Legionella micdadei]ARG99488.1 ribosomal protein L3 N(5)-glutamine methyltransferase [Legionella micdadei]